MTINKIYIAKDFSKFPAGRYLDDGNFNGTKFRKEILVPELKKLRESESLEVIFDGVAGFGSSFLEEAFGGLVRDEGFSKEFLKVHLILTTEEDELQDFVQLALRYIDNAANV